MSDAIKLAIDFLHCVDQRFDLAKEPHAPGVTMLDQFHAALAALRAQPESVCPECHCHFTANEVTAPGSTRLVNTAQPDHSEQHLEMIAAARAVVDRWDSPLWKDVPATAVYINRLRDALPAIGETME